MKGEPLSLCYLTAMVGSLLVTVALAKGNERKFSRVSAAENERIQQACGNADFPSRSTAPLGETDANGDQIVPRGRYPWAVSISMHGRLECAGVIISPRHILSSSYCVE